MRLLKQSTAVNILVIMIDSTDHISGKTGLTLTITSSKAGAAFASISPTVTERTVGGYQLALTTGHTDTLGDLVLHITGTGADPQDIFCQVVAFDPADTVRLGLTALPNAAAEAAGGLYTRGTGAGQINQNANGQIDSRALTLSTTSGVKFNTALSNFEFFMRDSADHISGKTGLTITSERSIDGGAFAASTNTATEVSAGVYKINLSAADLNGTIITLKFTGTGADPTILTIKTEG